MSDRLEVTTTLAHATRGNAAASARLMDLVYGELRELTERQLRHASSGRNVEPTSVVHDAYIRLVDAASSGPKDRTHFFATAAIAIRRVLVDRYRRAGALKRGGDRRQVPLDGLPTRPIADVDLLALDESLQKLELRDPRQARIVELRFFGGLTAEEVATELGMSSRTVERDWRMARAWLRCELDDSE